MSAITAAVEARIAAQQRDSGLYPLEMFCPACGRGHLAGPGEGRCRECDALVTIYREHPIRARRRAR